MASGDLGDDFGLHLVLFYGDCRFSVRFALFGNLFDGFLLSGSSLYPNGLATGVLRIELLGVALGYSVGEAKFRIGNHLSLGFPLLGDAETRNPDVIFGADLRDQGIELAVGGGAVF